MALFARVISLVRNLTRRSRIERDLDDELRATLDLLTAEKIRGGMSPADAGRAAATELRIEPIKEQVRDARTGRFVDTIAQDDLPSVEELHKHVVKPLVGQVRIDLGDQVADLAATRLSLDENAPSVKQQADEIGVTRARVNQLVEREFAVDGDEFEIVVVVAEAHAFRFAAGAPGVEAIGKLGDACGTAPIFG